MAQTYKALQKGMPFDAIYVRFFCKSVLFWADSKSRTNRKNGQDNQPTN